jgi:hypothetical protein
MIIFNIFLIERGWYFAAGEIRVLFSFSNFVRDRRRILFCLTVTDVRRTTADVLLTLITFFLNLQRVLSN